MINLKVKRIENPETYQFLTDNKKQKITNTNKIIFFK